MWGSKDLLIGKRVQVPVWTDTWMMGDRYGTVLKITRSRNGISIAHVLLDKSKKTKRFQVQDLEEV